MIENRSLTVRKWNDPTFGVALLLALALFALGCGDSSNPAAAPGWGQPQVLGDAYGVYGALAGDGRGSAVMAWIPPLTSEPGAAIVARRFGVSTGWAVVETIAPPGPATFQSPAVAMSATGDIVAAWAQAVGLAGSRFAGRGWGAPQLVSRAHAGFGSSFRGSPALGMDAAGSALAVWDEGGTEISDGRQDASGHWTGPELVRSADAIGRPAIALNAGGTALAAWAEGREGAQTLWASVFNPRRGWAAPQRIGPERPLFVYALQAALNDSEEGFVCWTQDDPRVDGDDTVFASHHLAASGFAAPENLGRGGCQGVAVDSRGNALALQAQPPRTLVRRYMVGRGWEPADAFPALDAAGGAALSMDTAGGAWILWVDVADGYTVRSRQFTLAQGLGPALEVAAHAAGSGVLPQVVSNDQGGAVAAWFDQPAAPSSRPVRVLANRFVTR
ncbi:MAG TPA: hypothetical protein VF310_08245 [Vicinamibacteria bacterium]